MLSKQNIPAELLESQGKTEMVFSSVCCHQLAALFYFTFNSFSRPQYSEEQELHSMLPRCQELGLTPQGGKTAVLEFLCLGTGLQHSTPSSLAVTQGLRGLGNFKGLPFALSYTTEIL